MESFNIYENTQLKKPKYANKHFLEILNSQLKEVRALRGYFGPPLWGQKIKVALHKFLFISLLEQ